MYVIKIMKVGKKVFPLLFKSPQCRIFLLRKLAVLLSFPPTHIQLSLKYGRKPKGFNFSIAPGETRGQVTTLSRFSLAKE
ncbi:hypothetical protein SAMN05444412_108126 [Rhodonellum ikkaensis]|uniref:Uncharacterized protein n=1 Tax=Rhodonellum ikkaensis TaxID=336829 RepID=A0A1H3RIP7_9BACT|nr:hypothetical protein SAMN05444412_108126 [Rhodonellum ikkaensis]